MTRGSAPSLDFFFHHFFLKKMNPSCLIPVESFEFELNVLNSGMKVCKSELNVFRFSLGFFLKSELKAFKS